MELEYDWWEFQFQILPWNRKQLQLVCDSLSLSFFFSSSWGSFLVWRMEKLSIDHIVFSLCLNLLHWHKYSWMVKLIHPGRLLVLGYLPEVGMLLICCQSPVTHLFLSETKIFACCPSGYALTLRIFLLLVTQETLVDGLSFCGLLKVSTY